MPRKPSSRSARVAESEPTVGQRLQSLVQRVERLTEEKNALSSDVRDIYKEAKSAGFDTKVLRLLIRRRQREPSEIEAEENLLDTYVVALENVGRNSPTTGEEDV